MILTQNIDEDITAASDNSDSRARTLGLEHCSAIRRKFTNAVLFSQVDVAGEYKETREMIEELMKMTIPEYKPSSNHVHLSDKGRNSFLVIYTPYSLQLRGKNRYTLCMTYTHATCDREHCTDV